jgi:hypothetical protein
MAVLSQRERDTITKYPLRSTLDHLLDTLRHVEQSYKPAYASEVQIMDIVSNEAASDAILDLFLFLRRPKTAFHLPSKISGRNLASDLNRIHERIHDGEFNYEHYCPPVLIVIEKGFWICACRAWDREFEYLQKDRPQPSRLTRWYIGSYDDIADA